MKNISGFYLEMFSFWRLNFSIYLNRRVFVMGHENIHNISVKYEEVLKPLQGTNTNFIFWPSCSKLTMSLVNDSLKFTSSNTQIC